MTAIILCTAGFLWCERDCAQNTESYYWCVVKVKPPNKLFIIFEWFEWFFAIQILWTHSLTHTGFELIDFGHGFSFELRFSVKVLPRKLSSTVSRSIQLIRIACNQSANWFKWFCFCFAVFFSRIQNEPSRWIKMKLLNKREKKNKSVRKSRYFIIGVCVHVPASVSADETIIRFKVKVKSRMWICTEFKLIELVPFSFRALVFHLLLRPHLHAPNFKSFFLRIYIQWSEWAQREHDKKRLWMREKRTRS